MTTGQGGQGGEKPNMTQEKKVKDQSRTYISPKGV
jgi:hypothetical protein